MEARLITGAVQAAWRAQTDQQIQQRQQQIQGHGRRYGFGRPFNPHAAAAPPPICRHCGGINLHFPDKCPQRHAPRTDLRQVRAPIGIPASFRRDAAAQAAQKAEQQPVAPSTP